MKKVNNKVRTALQTMISQQKNQQHQPRAVEYEKERTGMQLEDRATEEAKEQYRSRALEKDVDMIAKKLQQEEIVHRVLEMALSRPLGAPPYLPPDLPSDTRELVEEVAKLEDEVALLEEQVLSCRKELRQEATVNAEKPCFQIDSPKNSVDESKHVPLAKLLTNFDRGESLAEMLSYSDHDEPSPTPVPINKRQLEKTYAKRLYSPKIEKPNKPPRARTLDSRVKTTGAQVDYGETTREMTEESSQDASAPREVDESGNPNKISETLLHYLLNILSKTSSLEETKTSTPLIASSNSACQNKTQSKDIIDPYNKILKYGRQDIGRYKYFKLIEYNSVNPNSVPGSSPKMKMMLRKLAFVDLRGLNHQQKLAFWINIYNSCMLNAFLEHWISANPKMAVELKEKAMINVGGRTLSAMMIQHLILGIPFPSSDVVQQALEDKEITLQSVKGLDRPEPLVTFALSCGTWSSPAVRVYTAPQVENELEMAKDDYLQATVSISSSNKLVIPKLLDWYLKEFVTDEPMAMASWITSQLPTKLRRDATKCLERAQKYSDISEAIRVLPYDFSFRYILAG